MLRTVISSHSDSWRKAQNLNNNVVLLIMHIGVQMNLSVAKGRQQLRPQHFSLEIVVIVLVEEKIGHKVHLHNENDTKHNFRVRGRRGLELETTWFGVGSPVPASLPPPEFRLKKNQCNRS